MYIKLLHRDVPELSVMQITSATELDDCVEKELILNPVCYARILMEFVRTTCNLGTYTNFDLCDESGQLMGLLTMPTYEYATNLFEHKKTYYIIVIKTDVLDRRVTYLPQLSHQNPRYAILKENILLKSLQPTTARVSVGDSTKPQSKKSFVATPTLTTKSKKK